MQHNSACAQQPLAWVWALFRSGAYPFYSASLSLLVANSILCSNVCSCIAMFTQPLKFSVSLLLRSCLYCTDPAASMCASMHSETPGHQVLNSTAFMQLWHCCCCCCRCRSCYVLLADECSMLELLLAAGPSCLHLPWGWVPPPLQQPCLSPSNAPSIMACVRAWSSL